MIIQLENVILISRNSETVLLLLLDYFGARTNFALAYPSPSIDKPERNQRKQKIGEPLPEERNCSPRAKAKLDKGKSTRRKLLQITITTPQIHN